MTRTQAYVAIFLTSMSTVYGQIVIKWQVNQLQGFVTSTWLKKTTTLLGLLINPWIISSLGASVLACLLWMAAMTRLDLSQAYPFMMLNLVIISISGAVFFNEVITINRAVGIGFIILGLLILGRP